MDDPFQIYNDSEQVIESEDEGGNATDASSHYASSDEEMMAWNSSLCFK